MMSYGHLPLRKMVLVQPLPWPASDPGSACNGKCLWVERSRQLQHQPGILQHTGSTFLGRVPWPGCRKNSLYRGSGGKARVSKLLFLDQFAGAQGNMRPCKAWKRPLLKRRYLSSVLHDFKCDVQCSCTPLIVLATPQENIRCIG